MGLYLAVFDGDEELEGVEVGSYADFALFREAASRLEPGVSGPRFPTLMFHSDCDGSWSVDELARLQVELEQIANEFHQLPPLEPRADSWQHQVAGSLGITPTSLYDSLFDVDGEPLIERLLQLVRIARKHGREILLQ